ncbi:MarR family transcriptional regulator [Halanaeroarchaeum sulfurireducens]|uniref:HTH marR-type domain-containing protein n=1 Tax=Halanaeroarchaeum sulfurireducens TaxID=1604004 RepID=A0A0F7PBX1_9EURY|nr:MarR family transcriptional regulator [Halanaeroarchaeum sulfurireducens]AKH98217.1 hypothetical protein HLASF_1744 [Halanaeroarchaeum sulfurireducens]ALG82611.1 hypothetical protein HLASA_1730 [Halanaeroarchaeum sulfurireducens]
MTETYLSYASKVPKEVRLAADGLSGQNDLRWALLVALIEEGALSFSKLKEMLDVHQQSLSNALKALQKGGMIKKKAGKDLGSEQAGNYSIAPFGQKILDGFYSATEPKFEQSTNVGNFQSVPNYNGAHVQGFQGVEVKTKSKVAKDTEYDRGTSFENPVPG